MSRKTAKDFHPEVLKIFDGYVHGNITRRDFLQKAARFAIGGVTSLGLLEALAPRFAQAQQVKENDSRIEAGYVEYPAPEGYGTVAGYLVRPARGVRERLPAVLVVHENRGLNPHIEDVARRLALDGFIAFAPDALFPLGGYPGDEDKARELFTQLDKDKTRNDFIAAARALKLLPDGNGRVGAVGFCYGGGVVNFLATRLPDLAAGVSFYGGYPSAEDVIKIKAPLLLQFAEIDDRINAGWPEYEGALKAAAVNYQAYIYSGVQHGFNNDTTPRYDEAAAKLAWQRTVEFFEKYLRG
ncbi:carboxymethylenebutenolidase [Methylophilaceae bacterium]|nr:carboxymethylenebutenolidase [Methylophilaceae bacterium]